LAGAQWRVLQALNQINKANLELAIDEPSIYKIIYPSRLLEVTLPVEFKGKTYMCLGFRAWFDNGLLHKPGQIVKGGIRFLSVEPKRERNFFSIANEIKARKLALDDVMALGLEMLAKNSGTNFARHVLIGFGLAKKNHLLAELDLAGGAKGVIVAPRSLHEADHNEFTQKALAVFGYKLGIAGMVGWDKDVPAGDIGTTGKVGNNSVLDSFVDGYARALKDLGIKMRRNLIVGVITGKTANKKYLGNPARATSTGLGTVEALKVWAESKKIKINDLRVVFDGAGNAALPAAKFLVNSGISVVGMTDSRSAIYIKNGLSLHDLEEISRFKAERKSLADWSNWTNKSYLGKSKELVKKAGSLEKAKVQVWQKSGINVLFVSSDAMIINAGNVAALPKDILIVDGANGPVTPIAEKKLASKNIDHLTGSFANSGGVIGSLIEWSANVGNFSVSKDKAEEYIRFCIRSNFRVMKNLVDKGVVESLADAFYYVAMERYLRMWVK